MKKVLFRFSGGLGKQIIATSVVKAFKAVCPESIVHVQTSYPEAFANNPLVDKYFQLAAIPYFYDEHKDFDCLEAEPYLDLEYRQGKKHIVDAWCQRLGINAPKENTGMITLDESEIEIAKRILSQVPKDRKIVAFQWRGGTSYFDPNSANDLSRPKQYRDLPQEIAQAVVDGLSQIGCIVLQISLPTEPQLKGVIMLDQQQVINPRIVFAVLSQVDGLIAIDSFAQHAWVALGRKAPAIVLWGGTNPSSLGYAGNTNLTSSKGKECKDLHCNRPDTHMSDLTGNGRPWKCPLEGKCMQFDPKEIIEAMKGNLK